MEKSQSGKREKVNLLDKVYRFLAVRPRSEKEIADYLKKKKATPEATEKIFSLLKQQDLIDDSAFGEWWVEQRSTFRPKGKIALKAELKQKGIASEIIEKELEKINELVLAKKALAKKIRIFEKLPPEKFRQKITTFLSYRGFSWSTIKKILDKL